MTDQTIKQITVNNVTRDIEDSYSREILLTKQDKLEFDTKPTLGSNKMLTSGTIFNAIQNIQPGVSPSTAGPVFAGVGPIEDAKDYADSHNTYFQWLLVQPKDDKVITKVIWHISDGQFIDAIGAKF